MTKYRLTIQYIGTRYAGWQIQKDQKTVQGVLKEALEQVTGEVVSVVGSGRTDSGVHALRQVAHIRLGDARDPCRLGRALNGVLPRDIRILQVKRASPGFHAQKDAVKKRYIYRIYNGLILPPFLAGRVCHVIPLLDFPRMQAAAALILGRHDFSGFAAAASKVVDRRRTVYRSNLTKRGRRLRYQVEANGFLHHMVRNIVGTLLEIGRGRRAPSEMLAILESQDRRNAGPTAPAEGLYLDRVWY